MPATVATPAVLAHVLGIPAASIRRYAAAGKLAPYGTVRCRMYCARELMAVREVEAARRLEFAVA